MEQLQAEDIIIAPDRQRRANREIDENFIESVRKRLINPIVVRWEGTDCILVAGERRLSALKAAGIMTLIHNTHYRFFSDLAPDEAEIIELEENTKRLDLHWRDMVRATGRLVDILSARGLKRNEINKELNQSQTNILQILTVYKNLDKPMLRDASNWTQAFNMLQQAAERRAVSVVQDIVRASSNVFSNGGPPNANPANSGVVDQLRSSVHSAGFSSSSQAQSLILSPSADYSPNNLILPQDAGPVINGNFLDWAPRYNGPKFTLIHCDFPYDIMYDSYAKSLTSSKSDDYDFTGYWPLVECLSENLDRLMSYSAHMLFWFSMKFYQDTKNALEAMGLYVHEHPFVWWKTDNAGIIPGRDGIFPRRVYETAFLCTRGRRPLVKQAANCYGAPTQSNPIHPSTKPVPVLNHFLSMLIDETTDVLDPTCGSGNALKSAIGLGARYVVGLELNEAYAQAANANIKRI